MKRRTPPLVAAALAVGASFVVVAIWSRRPASVAAETALEATRSLRISRLDALGLAPRPLVVRDPARVQAIVKALGVDAQPVMACLPDYASAEIGLVLSGVDIYARRNVYVWNLFSDGGTPAVLVTSSVGCRGGPPPDASRLRELLSLEESDASGFRKAATP